jgi:hypothetical protein
VFGGVFLLALVVVIVLVLQDKPPAFPQPGGFVEQPPPKVFIPDPGLQKDFWPKDAQAFPNPAAPPEAIARTLPENEIEDTPREKPFAVDPQLAKAVDKVFLSDLQEFAWKPGPGGWTFGKNGQLGSTWAPGGRILVKGAVVEKGLSMHPPDRGYTRVCYAVGRRAKSLHGAAAISEDEAGSKPPPTRFVILGDGKFLWRSGSIRAFQVTEAFNLDVSAVDLLELRTYVEADNFGAHAAWVDPYLVPKAP